MSMSKQRSKVGCWTCRVRKKKCDETHPECDSCTSLKIQCYGYASRPTWMDGGEEEKKVVSRFRDQVKEASRQKKRKYNQTANRTPKEALSTAQQHQQITISDVPHGKALSLPTPEGTHSSGTTIYETEEPSSQLTPDLPGSRTRDDLHSPHLPYRGHINATDATLWMHYLDRTFPHQFPFYRPTTREGGRGWLWILVIQTEPLYHAVLSLAAYHQYYEQLCEADELNILLDSTMANEQLRRYNLALKKLQIYLQDSISRDVPMLKAECLKLLACIVFLISLEVFKSTGSAWRIHLAAAANLLPQMIREDTEPLQGVQVHAWKFVSGIIAWYDTIACTQSSPISLISETWDWCGTGFLPLCRIMGCQTWAMSQIREITALRRWKKEMQNNRTLSMRELSTRAVQIEKKLEDGMREIIVALDAENVEDDLLATEMIGDYGSRRTSYLITRIFASAALTYLFTVVSGPNAMLSEIQESVSRTIATIKALPRLKFFCNLTWPLTITGCLSIGESREVFVQYMEKYMTKPHGFGSSQHILKIVEECWRQQADTKIEEDIDNTKAMKSLNLDILLV